MSKKNAPQQLQTDIHTDEQLQAFMQKDGLLLLEIYTAWCGPCVSMVSALKKVKLEKCGEDLVLATVCADKCETFERLRLKSEPTWLLARNFKTVNGMFGSNVPQLIKMIIDETEIYRQVRDSGTEVSTKLFELHEMVPCEQERYNKKKEIEDRNEKLAKETSANNRVTYITACLTEVGERLSDFGVVILQPHCINRDVMKQLPNAGEKFGLTAKDKKLVQIKESDLEVMHFDCANRMPKHALDLLFAKECFMVAFKNADSELRPVELIIRQLVDSLVLPQPIAGDMSPRPVRMDPVLPSLTVKISMEDEGVYLLNETDDDRYARERVHSFIGHRKAAAEHEASVAAELAAISGPPPAKESVGSEPKEGAEAKAEGAEGAVAAEGEAADGPKAEGAADEGGVKSEAPAAAEAAPETKPEEVKPEKEADAVDEEKNPDEAGDEDEDAEEAEDEEEEEGDEGLIVEEAGPEEELVEYEVMPLWTPINKTANAALVYLYFRNLTDHFLAPDPEPDPPHLAVAFDAFKRDEVMVQLQLAPQEVLAYGYFTNETPGSGKLMATSTLKYNKLKKRNVTNDRLVVKVAKRTSHMLLTLSLQAPCYVSMNTVEGQQDCAKFFPEGYKMSSEVEGEEDDEDEAEFLAQMEAAAAKEEELAQSGAAAPAPAAASDEDVAEEGAAEEAAEEAAEGAAETTEAAPEAPPAEAEPAPAAAPEPAPAPAPEPAPAEAAPPAAPAEAAPPAPEAASEAAPEAAAEAAPAEEPAPA